VQYVYHRLTHCANVEIASRRLPVSFTGAQVGLVVTQRAYTGIALVAHDVPADVASPSDVTGCHHHRGL
jgi:hypothetical protein